MKTRYRKKNRYSENLGTGWILVLYGIFAITAFFFPLSVLKIYLNPSNVRDALGRGCAGYTLQRLLAYLVR